MDQNKKKSSYNLLDRFKGPKLLIAAVFVAAFASFGVYQLMPSHAASAPWANAASFYGCALTGYGVPGGTLQVNSTGPCVKLLQAGLNLDMQVHLSADGQLGTTTLAAVTFFNDSKKITPDKVVGPATWAALATTYNQNYPIYSALSTAGTYLYNPVYSAVIALSNNYYSLNGSSPVKLTVGRWFNGSTSTTHFVQYGPYTSMAILPGQHGLHVCYDYATYNAAADASGNNYTGSVSVYNDVVFNADATTTTVGGITQNIAFDKAVANFQSNPSFYYPMRTHCTDYPMAVAYYPKLEFRLRVNSSTAYPGVPNYGDLDLYRTRVNVY